MTYPAYTVEYSTETHFWHAYATDGTLIQSGPTPAAAVPAWDLPTAFPDAIADCAGDPPVDIPDEPPDSPPGGPEPPWPWAAATHEADALLIAREARRAAALAAPYAAHVAATYQEVCGG